MVPLFRSPSPPHTGNLSVPLSKHSPAKASTHHLLSSRTCPPPSQYRPAAVLPSHPLSPLALPLDHLLLLSPLPDPFRCIASHRISIPASHMIAQSPTSPASHPLLRANPCCPSPTPHPDLAFHITSPNLLSSPSSSPSPSIPSLPCARPLLSPLRFFTLCVASRRSASASQTRLHDQSYSLCPNLTSTASNG